ncbi:unnamed protein product, partial [Pylaiella littoralis]
GSDAEGIEWRYQTFVMELQRAVFNSASMRLSGSSGSTCMEAELSKPRQQEDNSHLPRIGVAAPPERAGQRRDGVLAGRPARDDAEKRLQRQRVGCRSENE